MGQDRSITSLRTRVAELVAHESTLLNQAFELSRAGGARPDVDALFAQVQAVQVERHGLKKEIGNLLGMQRLHSAAEVWKPGIYDYRREVAGASVRVRVATGPLGLQAFLPGRADAVNLESLRGTFDGPLAVDDGSVHQEAPAAPAVPRKRPRG